MKKSTILLVTLLVLLFIYTLFNITSKKENTQPQNTSQSKKPTSFTKNTTKDNLENIKKEPEKKEIAKEYNETVLVDTTYSIDIDTSLKPTPDDIIDNNDIEPLWTEENVLNSTKSASSWFEGAEALMTIDITNGLIEKLSLGKSFSLPVPEKPSYIVIKETLENNDTIWITEYLGETKEYSRYGVVSEGEQLFLMTLYTDLGAYYINSNNKETAEVSYMSYEKMKELKEKSE